MKIIILAAGRGTRLKPLTDKLPKCLIDLGKGKTILSSQLDSIKKSNIFNEVIIVVGYLYNKIEKKIENYIKEGMKITLVYNPFYDSSDNLISLWLSKHLMNEEFMITNGDNIFTEDIFKSFKKNTKEGIYVVTTLNEKFIEDDMKVIINNNKIININKTISISEANAESVGLIKISGEKWINKFVKSMDRLVKSENNIDSFWLEIFNELIRNKVDVLPFEIDRNKWQEMDFHIDIDMARNLLNL